MQTADATARAERDPELFLARVFHHLNRVRPWEVGTRYSSTPQGLVWTVARRLREGAR